MKLFEFSFLICALQASSAFPQKKVETQNVQNLKFEATKVIAELQQYAANIGKNLWNQFNQDEENVKHTVGNLEKNVLKETKIDNMKFFKEGGDANFCYKSAFQNLNVIFENATNDIRKCQFETIFLGYTPVYRNVNFTIAMSYDVLENFDTIIKNCEFFGDECLINHKPGTQILLNGLKTTVKKLKKLAFEVSTEVVLKSASCITEATIKLNEESDAIKKLARKCIINN